MRSKQFTRFIRLARKRISFDVERGFLRNGTRLFTQPPLGGDTVCHAKPACKNTSFVVIIMPIATFPMACMNVGNQELWESSRGTLMCARQPLL